MDCSEKLMLYISGALPLDERQEVYNWIMSNDDNMAEYKAARRLYDISLWTEPSKKKTASRRVRTFSVIFAAAATIILVAGIMFRIGKGSAPQQPVYFKSVTAPAGKELQMQLADGSLVWLNSQSTLTVLDCPDGKERRVFLDGEGYFEITHNPARPFIVETSKLSVMVIGTKFNLSAYKDKDLWETALFDGSVAILDRHGKELVTMAPGTNISYDGEKLVASYLDENNYLWREGILYFNDASTKDILTEVCEFFDITLAIAPDVELGRRFTGKFRTVDGYQHVFKVLRRDGQFKYKILDDSGKVTVSITKSE